ncbi:hypothetical protein EDM80_06110 [bacterium]|nr:MAG: hypothetical protein EDM80_06110 [bacterium]RIK63745.1 MAG: hypothetical protein DCC64_06420 [Planctomycetota bacterium]
MKRWTLFALTLSLLGGAVTVMPVRADEAPRAAEAPKMDEGHAAAIKAYERYQAVQKTSSAARAEALKVYREAKGEEAQKVALEKYQAVVEEQNARVEAARDEFVSAFDKANLDAWDLKAHAEVVEMGLLMSGSLKQESDPKGAVHCYEKLLEKLPKSRLAGVVRSNYLPAALMMTGDYEAAQVRVEALVKEGDEMQRPGLTTTLGDIKAVKGDLEGAQKTYAEALKLIPADLEKNDVRASAKRYLEPRIALIGKPAPEINSKHWLGAEATALSAMKGTVLLIDVWATW